MSSQDTVSIKALPKSQVEVRATIPAAEWESERARAVASLNEEVTLDGFRKGHVPESVLIQKLGEFALLEEMAELAIARAYAELIRSKRLNPIGRPKIELTKIAKGNPLEFRLVTAVLPEIKLPDYAAIAKKHGALEDLDVPEKEVEETVTRILEMRARGSHDHADEHTEKKEPASIPELTDEYVKTLGNFSTVAEFKGKLKEEIVREKKRKAEDKRRSAILDAIVAKIGTELPDVLVDGEVDRMVGEFKAEIARVGGSWDEYLAHAKKTEAEIRAAWRPDAKKRSLVQLAIDAIAEKESIAPNEEDIARHADSLRQAYPDVEHARAADYVRHTETNRMVLEFLEKVAEAK